MPYESTHKFVISVTKDGKSEDKQIEQGRNKKLCFNQPGQYTLSPNSCYKFEKQQYIFTASSNYT